MAEARPACLRCSRSAGVMAFLRPLFPLRPHSAMNAEICALVGMGRFVIGAKSMPTCLGSQTFILIYFQVFLLVGLTTGTVSVRV